MAQRSWARDCSGQLQAEAPLAGYTSVAAHVRVRPRQCRVTRPRRVRPEGSKKILREYCGY